MKFTKIIAYKDELVFDNTDEQYYDFIIHFKDEFDSKIKLSNFKNLYKLESIFGEKGLYNLVNLIDGARENPSFKKAFSGSSGLPLYGYLSKLSNRNLVYIISTGEFQPGRYKIYLEGVWEIV